MRKWIVLLAIVAMAGVSGLAYAENVAQAIGDIIVGDNTYGNIEAVKRIELEKPILGLDEIQVGAYFYAELSEPIGSERVYLGGPKVKLIW